MKVTVTHLKAPWPQGCVPGDVVDLAGDTIPAWAVGKCTPAQDDAQAAYSLAAPAVEPAAPAVDPALAAAEAQAAQEKAAIEARAAKGRTAKG